jgi:hypothetical protein
MTLGKSPNEFYAFFPVYKAIKMFKDIIIPEAQDDFDFDNPVPMCLVLTKTEYQNAVYDFKMN